MKITLIAIGTKMPNWVTEGYTEYAKRLPAECSMRLIEIPAGKRGKGADLQRLILQEGERMYAAIPAGDYIVALTERGKLWHTPAFAAKLQTWQERGQGLSLLIGGPEGLSTFCLGKAQVEWSLSPLTWPHPLVRIMVAEQIYRAWSILSHHPYHR